MKIDAGSVWGFAALSLLTGYVVCTAPDELSEIDLRAKDIAKILKKNGHELVYANTSYMPYFADDKWPFATVHDNLSPRALAFAQKYPPSSDPNVDVDAFIEILKCEELEEKYGFSKVKSKCAREVLLPF